MILTRFLLLSLLLSSGFCYSQDTDSGTYIIHKNQLRIGEENFTGAKTASGFSWIINFHYVDRSSPVSLKAEIRLDTKGEPVYFKSAGGTSRFSFVRDSVSIRKQKAFLKVNDSSYQQDVPAVVFPIDGYNPVTAQNLLIRYWNRHKRPAKLKTLPRGELELRLDGTDTLTFKDKPLLLDRYVIKGLIWGNELLWADRKGNLICLVTNDAEGDKQEMMLSPYEALLPAFIALAPVDGMRLFSTNKAPVKNEWIAISGGSVLDVEKGEITPGLTVLLKDGKISQVGPSTAVSIPTGAKIVDATGKIVMPGLWDMHAHFSQPEWGPSYLAAGVTSVRDVGNEFDFINSIQKAIDDGTGPGPHILKAGIIDGKSDMSLGIVTADSREEAATTVQRYKNSGFVQIKLYSSVKPAMVKAICEEAHRLGMTVTGHIPEGMNIFQGVDSGMDMVNHIQYVLPVMKMNPSTFEVDLNDSANQAVFRFLKDHHTVIDPTLGVFEMVFRNLKDSITLIEPNFYTLPPTLQALFVNMGADVPKRVKMGQNLNAAFRKILKGLFDAGIPIVAGTDMIFPGYSLDRELELYVESGLTPAQAIRTATIVPAAVMKMESLTGTLAPGKRGDILILDRNPLELIRNIRSVSEVIKDGVIYDPAVLHRLAGFVTPDK